MHPISQRHPEQSSKTGESWITHSGHLEEKGTIAEYLANVCYGD